MCGDDAPTNAAGDAAHGEHARSIRLVERRSQQRAR